MDTYNEYYIEELKENIDIIQKACYRLEDVNLNLNVDGDDRGNMIDVKDSLHSIKKIYQKALEKIGGDTY